MKDKIREFVESLALEPKRTGIPVSGKIFDNEELVNAIDSVLEGWWTEGRYSREFCEKLSGFTGIKHIIPTNSGSSANLLAVSALTAAGKLKPDDEIITVAAAFPTTVNPIIQNGCVPVFVDVELGTYNINLGLIEPAITEKTRAIFIAHTLGNPFDAERIKQICEKHDLILIEDCCDALGSKLNGQMAGTFGDICTFSFYPAHHITSAEGGAVCTDDDALNRILVSLRDWGRDCWCSTGKDASCGKRFSQQLGDLPFGYDHKYTYSNLGYNLKWTDMQAAIACAQMEKLAGFIEKRKRNFRMLYDGLKKYNIVLPESIPGADPSWFGFPITADDRQNMIEHLNKNNIHTRNLFAGNIVKQPYFKGIKHRISGNLKNTDIIMNRTFWVGVYPGLTENNMKTIGETIIQCLEN